MGNKIKAVVVASIVAGSPMAGEVAEAGPLYQEVICASPKQLCDRAASRRVPISDLGQHTLELRAGPKHCSPIRYRWSIHDQAGREIDSGSTRPLEPNELFRRNVFITPPSLASGSVIIRARGWGVLGGCNTGRLVSYGVTSDLIDR